MFAGNNDESLAAQIDRVIGAVNLAEVSAADIDAFLGALTCDPFPPEKIRRILEGAGVPAAIGPEMKAAEPGAGQGPANRPLRAARKSTYRLACEELDCRNLPSQLGLGLMSRMMEIPVLSSSGGFPPGALTRAEAARVVNWDSGQAATATEVRLGIFTPALAEVAGDTLNSLFAGPDFHPGLVGHGDSIVEEVVVSPAPWDLFDSPADLAAAPLLLAG
jgi:hypothetical protein